MSKNETKSEGNSGGVRVDAQVGRDEGFVNIPLRLPDSIWIKIEPLAKAASLTIEQMTQAIIILQFNQTGWLKKDPEPPEPTPNDK